MKRFIRWGAALLALLLGLLPLTGCGGDSKNQITVRYLNFKPEIADKYQELATAYEQETGVRVIVDTAANNTYEQTLKRIPRVGKDIVTPDGVGVIVSNAAEE